jgi:translation initiation factor eIF-2B subunit gamma
MNTNPHLTGLPLPKPNILAPKDLDQNTGTAQIFRLPEVRAAINGDFIVLPCDLVCELGGESLIESWMVKEAGLGGADAGGRSPKTALDSPRGGRKGGLGVWYETKGETIVKGEETDFIATSPLETLSVPPPKSSLLSHVSRLVYSVPTDTLNDITEEKKTLPIRHSLVRAHSRIRMLSSHRDAHIYIFPAWVLDMINLNEHFDSIGEDVIGWWAKAGWQDGLGDKLGLREVFRNPDSAAKDDNLLQDAPTDDVDFASLSTTRTSKLQAPEASDQLVIPPILAYIHPSKPTPKTPTVPLIRRVDTAPLLLSISLQLAKLDSIENLGREASSPFAHQSKVAYPEGIASKTTVTRPDCLLAENVTVEEKCSIKECVIGANCQIKSGAKLTRCVLMDGVVVGKGCKLTGCILGKRSVIGEDSILVDCEVQENLLVEAKSKFYLSRPYKNALDADNDGVAEDKNNNLMSSEGMEATEEEIQGSFAEDGMALDTDEGAGLSLSA